MASEALVPGTRAWRNGRAALGAAGLLFAAVYLREGSGLRMGAMDDPGPGIFPMFAGVAFALVSAAVIAEALLTPTPGAAKFPRGASLVRLGVIFAAFVAYILVLEVIGFLAATTLFVAFYCRVVGRAPLWQCLACAVGLAAAVWVVFDVALRVELPASMWG